MIARAQSWHSNADWQCPERWECWIWPLRQVCFVCRTPSYACRNQLPISSPAHGDATGGRETPQEKRRLVIFLHQKMTDQNQTPHLRTARKVRSLTFPREFTKSLLFRPTRSLKQRFF